MDLEHVTRYDELNKPRESCTLALEDNINEISDDVQLPFVERCTLRIRKT